VDGKTGLSAAINMAAVWENELGMVVLGIASSPEPGANPTLDCAVETRRRAFAVFDLAQADGCLSRRGSPRWRRRA
jgi:hypothetical protein